MARTSAAHSINSPRVVAKMRPFGMAPCQCPDRPMRCQATRDGPGRSNLADQIHGADIDSQFQRCGRHQRFHFPGF